MVAITESIYSCEDPEFREQENHIIQQTLDTLGSLIKICEDPRSVLGRQALQNILETLPIQTLHLVRRH